MRTRSTAQVAPIPADDADELTWQLFRQDQVITRRQALRYLSAKAIRARLSSGRWRPVGAGVYLTHTGPATRQQQRWIAVLAAGPVRPAVLAGLSALECHGLSGHRSGVLHVLIPARSRDRDVPPGWSCTGALGCRSATSTATVSRRAPCRPGHWSTPRSGPARMRRRG